MIEPRCSKCTRGWEIPEEKDMETKSRRHRRDIQRARLELPNFYLLLLCLSSLEVPFTLSERFVIASLIVRADGLGRRDRDKMLSLHREKPTGTCHAICWPEFDFAFSLQFFMYPVRFWIRSSELLARFVNQAWMDRNYELNSMGAPHSHKQKSCVLFKSVGEIPWFAIGTLVSTRRLLSKYWLDSVLTKFSRYCANAVWKKLFLAALFDNYTYRHARFGRPTV